MIDFQAKAGPLPVWAWAALGGAGAMVYAKHRAGSVSPAPAAEPAPVTPAAGEPLTVPSTQDRRARPEATDEGSSGGAGESSWGSPYGVFPGTSPAPVSEPAAAAETVAGPEPLAAAPTVRIRPQLSGSTKTGFLGISANLGQG